MAISFNAKQIEKLMDALQSPELTNALHRSMNDALMQVAARNMIPPRTSVHQTVVSRKEHEALLAKYAAASQRLTMLLAMLDPNELKRIGLLPADAEISETDGWDRVLVLNALDVRIKTFTEAHARLTGKRKKIPETGSLELEGHELPLVAQMRARGLDKQMILQEIHRRRQEQQKRNP